MAFGQEAGDLTVTPDGDGLAISYRGEARVLQPTTFGDGVAISHVTGPDGGRHLIAITGLAGPVEQTDVEIDLVFERGLLGDWTLIVETRGWPAATTRFTGVPAADWLGRRVEPDVAVRSPTPVRIALQRLGLTWPEEVTIALTEDFWWRVSSSAGFRAYGNALRLREIVIRRLAPGGELDAADAPMTDAVLASGVAEVVGRAFTLGQASVAAIAVEAPATGWFRSRNWDGSKYRITQFEGEGWTLNAVRQQRREGPFPAGRGIWREHEFADPAPGNRLQTTLEVELREREFGVETRAGRLTLAGLVPGASFVTGMRVTTEGGRIIAFDGQARITNAGFAVAGADFSRLDLLDSEVFLAFAGIPPSIPGATPPTAAVRAGTLEFGTGRLVLPLDGSRLRIRRAADLVGLDFRFVGLALTIAAPAATVAPTEGAAKSRLIVHLPPQHVAERAYFRRISTDPTDYPEPDSPLFENFATAFKAKTGVEYLGRSTITNDLARFKAIADTLVAANEPEPETFDEITEARLSGESRLSFTVPGGAAPIAYSVAALTDWSQLDLAVVKRALAPPAARPGAEIIEDWLARFDIPPDPEPTTPEDALAQRMRAIRASLTSPCPEDTAIEFPFRLFLSPSEKARWRSSPAPDPDSVLPVPLWTTSLEIGGNDPLLRAIWSDDFRPNAFSEGTDPLLSPPRGPYPPWRISAESDTGALPVSRFRATLDAFDRHELVGLSSVHGLPVMPSIRDGLIQGSQVRATDNLRLLGAPTAPDSEPAPEPAVEAIYLPKTINVRELTLTALGASAEFDTAFQPPAWYDAYGNDPRFRTFSVERWRQSTVLGRDVAVEIVYKGYLFPLGLRAALVKVTERQFHRNPITGGPTAYLVQRMFIRIARPDKNFPALGQMNGGRAWPYRAIRLLTTRTPDIVDPWANLDAEDGDTAKSGLLTLGGDGLGPLEGSAFWPRTANRRGAEVLFQMQIDGAAEAVAWPMLFLDNQAARNATSIKRVVEFYNDRLREGDEGVFEASAPLPLVEIDHHGAERRYAAEREPGEATFVTHRVRVKAEGRAPGLEETAFTSSPDMEGQDQPAFYPSIEWAQIELKQARLTGQTPPIVRTFFPEAYLADGLPARDVPRPPEDGGAPPVDTEAVLRAKNPLEMFLALAEEFALDAARSGAGAQVGGVVQLAAHVYGIGRVSGIIGNSVARPSTPRPERHSAGDAIAIDVGDIAGVTATSLAPEIPNFDVDPDVILQKLFGKTRILGLVSPVDVVKAAIGGNAEQLSAKAAPKVRQIFDYDATDALDRVLPLIEEGLGLIQRMLDDLDEEAGTPIVSRLYPDLHEGLQRAVAAVGELRTATSTDDFADDISAGARLYSAGRGLIAAVDRIAADPLAPIRDEARSQILGFVSRFGAAIDAQTASLLAEIGVIRDRVNAAIALLEGEILDLVDSGTAAALGTAVTEIRTVLAIIDSGSLPPLESLLDAVTGAATAVARAYVEAAAIEIAGDALLRCDDALGAVRDVVLATGARAMLTIPPNSSVAAELEDEIAAITAEARLHVLDQLQAISQRITAVATGLLQPDNDPLAQAFRAWTAEANRWVAHLGGVFDRLFGPGATVTTDITDLVARLESISAGLGGALACTPAGFQRLLTLRTVFESGAGALPKGNVVRAIADAVKLPAGLSLDGLRRVTVALATEIGRVAANDARGLLIREAAARVAEVYPRIAAATGTLFDTATELLRLGSILGARITTTLNGAQEALQEAADEVPAVLRPPLAAAAVFVGAIAREAGDLADAQEAVDDELTQLREDIEDLNLATPPTLARAAELIGIRGTAFDAAEDLREAIAALPGAVEAAADAVIERTAAFVQKELAQLLLPVIEVLATASGEVLNRLGATVPLLALPFSLLHRIDAAVGAGRATLLAGMGDLLNEYPALSEIDSLFQLGIANGALLTVPVDPSAPTPPAECVAAADRIQSGAIDDALTAETILFGCAAAAVKALRPDAGADAIALLQEPGAVRSALELIVSATGANGVSTLAVRRLYDKIADLVGRILRLDIAGFVNFGAIRDALESALREMIPSKVRFSYDFGTKVGKIPADRPIFGIDLPDDTPEEIRTRDLLVTAKTEIDLLNGGTPVMNVRGELGPFFIHLFPGSDTFDVVRIHFKRAIFTVAAGSDPDLDLAIDGVTLGPAAEFLQELQAYMSPKGNGFFIRPSLAPPGVEAGYILNLGTISIGTLSFINVGIAASIDLPFTDDEPRFKVSISTRDAPFLISAAPYGGGGFLGLIANAQKILGFEASFEYGGVAAFSYGPLDAIGRITVGVFVRQTNQSIMLEGFFFAGGSGRIACFGFSSSFLLTLSHNLNTGEMRGRAVYTFSFKIGFARFSYSIEIWKVEGKGFSLASAAAGSRYAGYAPLRLAMLGNHGVAELGRGLAACPGAPTTEIRSDGVCQTANWQTYLTYFDETLF